MQTATPGWLPDAQREPEALIREARWHQRRRWLATGAALLMVAAGVAAVIAGSAAGSRPRPPGRPVTVAVKPARSELIGLPMPPGSHVRLLLTGRRPAGRLSPAPPARRAAPPALGRPSRTTSSLTAPLARRASPPGYEVAASDRSGAMWLITFRRAGADITTTPALAQEVTTAGRRLGPRYRLPAGYLFRRAVGGYLLLGPVVEATQKVVIYKLWDPAIQRVVRTFGDVIATGPRQIAWGPICVHCPVRVLSLLTGTTATMPLPRGTWASNQGGTFSRRPVPGLSAVGGNRTRR
jgi:hypothetical protein